MKLPLYDHECSSIDEIEESIKNNGHFRSNNSIIFGCGSPSVSDDHFMIFDYDIYIDGYVEVDYGDYWTPPYSETIINSFDIEITKVYYVNSHNNEIYLELDTDSVKSIIHIIRNYYPL